MLSDFKCNGVGSEAIEWLRFLASLSLAGTRRKEGGEKTQHFNRFQSRLGMSVFPPHVSHYPIVTVPDRGPCQSTGTRWSCWPPRALRRSPRVYIHILRRHRGPG